MPKIKCKNCGKNWNGWALKYKPCYCDCGNWLNWDLYIPQI